MSKLLVSFKCSEAVFSPRGEIETAILSPGTEKMAEALPLRRLGKPEEVARTIYYLCTAESSYVTGVEIEINGGQHV